MVIFFIMLTFLCVLYINKLEIFYNKDDYFKRVYYIDIGEFYLYYANVKDT